MSSQQLELQQVGMNATVTGWGVDRNNTDDEEKLRIYANNCKDIIIRIVTHNHNHNDSRKNRQREREQYYLIIRIRVNMRRGMNAISKIPV